MLATSQPLPTPSLSVRWPEGGPAPLDVPPSKPPGESGGTRTSMKRKPGRGASTTRVRARQRPTLNHVSKAVTSRRLRGQGPNDDVSREPSQPKPGASSTASSLGKADQAPGEEGSGDGGVEDGERSETLSSPSPRPEPDASVLQPCHDAAVVGRNSSHLQSQRSRQELLERMLALSGSEESECRCQSVLDVGLSPWHPSPSCLIHPPRALKKSRKKEQTSLNKAFLMPELNGEGGGGWKFHHLEDPRAYITEYRRLLCVGGVGKTAASASTIRLGVHVPDPYLSRLKILWPGFYDVGEDSDSEPEYLTAYRLSMGHRERKERCKSKTVTAEAELQRLARLQTNLSRSQEQTADPGLDLKTGQLSKGHVTRYSQCGSQPPSYPCRQHHSSQDSKEEKVKRPLVKEPTRTGREKMPILHIATLVDPQALSDSLNRYRSLQQQQQQQTRLPLVPHSHARVMARQDSQATGPCPAGMDTCSASSRVPPVPLSPTPKLVLTSSSLPASSRLTLGQPLASKSRRSSGKSRRGQLTLDGKVIGSHVDSICRSSVSSASSSSSNSPSTSSPLEIRCKVRSLRNIHKRVDVVSHAAATLTPLSVSFLPVAPERKPTVEGRYGVTPEIERECSCLSMPHGRGSMPDIRYYSNELQPNVIDVSFTATSALDPNGSRARGDRGREDRLIKRTAYRY